LPSGGSEMGENSVMLAKGQSFIALAWGEEGLRDLFRLRAVLEKVGISSEIEFGLGDEGDPWCVFCRPRSERVLAHFAFIDGEFIGDWAGLRRIVRSNQLGEVIDQFLQMTIPSSLASRATGLADQAKFQ
jgi:collagen type I/II/III/V/XI/XXIV/XXVII alpha